MKKLIPIVVILILRLLTFVGCNSVSKEEYDKIENELSVVREENDNLKQKAEWLKKYQGIEFGSTKEDIIAVLSESFSEKSSSNGDYFMEVITWRNNSLFNYYEKDDNSIVIGFRDNIVIFKGYGLKAKNIIINSDNGIIYTSAKGVQNN